MALKRSNIVAMHHHWNKGVLQGPYTCQPSKKLYPLAWGIVAINPKKNCIVLLGGLSPVHLMQRCRAQGLMLSARGPFPQMGTMVVTVVMLVSCVSM